MKINFRYKISLSFLIVLTAATLLFSYLFIKRDSQLKLDRLVYYMQPYTDIIYSQIKEHTDRSYIQKKISSLDSILPQEMRITILDTNAWVIFDNFSQKNSITDNHLSRPELKAASINNIGNALRFSNSLNTKYLYYAKKYPEFYIRTALEYNSTVYPIIKGDKYWQIYILIIFLIAVVAIIYITQKLSKPFFALKEFVQRVHQKEDDYDSVKFPKDELGEVGEQIMYAFKQLDNAKKYKQQLTHNIAHELKTPLTGIQGYLETLLQQENIDKKQARFFLERAFAQSLRLSALVNDISILNKIEEAANEFEFENINILKCLKEIENDLAFKLEENNIRFFAEISTDTTIQGSYLLIYSLFKNLIDNSIDHAGKNIEIHIIQTGISKDEVFFSYQDTGKGIPQEHLHRIFERFYRVEKGRSRKDGGSGLGLSIVKNAVMLHNGKISVTNRQGGGIRFDFTLSLKSKTK